MRKERYYVKKGNITYATIYLIMDGSNDRKLAECYFMEDASLIVKALNKLNNKKGKENG